jgi:hypothetical protein
MSYRGHIIRRIVWNSRLKLFMHVSFPSLPARVMRAVRNLEPDEFVKKGAMYQKEMHIDPFLAAEKDFFLCR